MMDGLGAYEPTCHPPGDTTDEDLYGPANLSQATRSSLRGCKLQTFPGGVCPGFSVFTHAIAPHCN